MNEPRRTRRYFDEDQRPTGVTFDDGERSRRNMPWMRFASAEWDHSDPATIRVEIGDWQVVITGHNLESLFRAIEQAKLARVRAYPEFADDPTHENDVFVTSIRFVHLSSAAGKRVRAPTQSPTRHVTPALNVHLRQHNQMERNDHELGNPTSEEPGQRAASRRIFPAAPPGERDPFFGLSRGWYYKAAALGEIKMVAVRNGGAIRGVRLVAYDSVLDYIRRSMSESLAM